MSAPREASERASARPWRDRAGPFFALALGVAAAAVRVPGLFTDFWLDEVWSLLLAGEVDGPLGVFTQIKHDNNHHLNTLILYALGDRDAWLVYRIPALLAGTGAVALAGLAARWRGGADALFAMALTGGSFLLIHYSTEARGYAFSVLFGFAIWLAAQRYAGDPRWRNAAWLWLCAGLGLLSHLLTFHVLAGASAWLVAELAARGGGRRLVASRLARGLLPPALFTAGTYAFLVRGMMIGGGPPYQIDRVLMRAGSYALGGPTTGPGAAAAALAFGALCAGAVLWMRRQGRREWIFFAVAIALSPIALLLASPPPVLFERYFLISVAIGSLAIAHLLADLARRGAPGRAVAAAAVALFLAGNGTHWLRFHQVGRGHYREAVATLAEQTPGPSIAVASDDDVGNKMLLIYYQRFLPPGKTIRYFDRSEVPARRPRWRIHHRVGEPGEVPESIRDERGALYDLEKHYPAGDLSGFHWLLYRRRGATP